MRIPRDKATHGVYLRLAEEAKAYVAQPSDFPDMAKDRFIVSLADALVHVMENDHQMTLDLIMMRKDLRLMQESIKAWLPKRARR